MNAPTRGLGPVGRLAGAFLHSRITPLVVIASVLLGVLALATLPREEEPQIQVPMVDLQVAWPGTPVGQVERQLTTPLERALWQIPDLEYLYSTSRDDGALLIARFKVGMSPDQALTRVRSRLDQTQGALPAGAHVMSVAPRAIDDVPILVLTLSAPTRPDLGDAALRRVGAELAEELRKEPGVATVQVLGGEPRRISVAPRPEALAAAGVTWAALEQTLRAAGVSLPAGASDQGGAHVDIRADAPLTSVAQLRALPLRAADGRVLRLGEIADIVDGPGERTGYVFHASRHGGDQPAVALAVSKRPGVNATALVAALRHRVDGLHGTLLGREIAVDVSRDYGESAKHKSDDLMFHLLLATLSVITLIAFALGRREALVVAVAIPVTLALTLFVYRFLGYTLNRVTLFALIFSIGILVDDAIVVVENIARHASMRDDRRLDTRVVEAVDEVGNPTVLATVTVIAAILPLAFVGGLMGPYMKPIPIGASLAMAFSVLVAFIVSPWAARRLLKPHGAAHAAPSEGRMDRLYRTFMGRLLHEPRTRSLFFAAMGVLLLAAMSLFAFRAVIVKMLPFDNKSELSVLLDLPPGATLESSLAAAREAGRVVLQAPEVEGYDIYTGVGAPVTFNGLVRHYDMRGEARLVELQVRLVEAKKRHAQSHAIAKRLRPLLQPVAARYGARLKVVEVPPGPPVLSTLVAEIYGPTLEGQRALARQVLHVFDTTPGVVDTDFLHAGGQPRARLDVDRERAVLAGVAPAEVTSTLAAAFGGSDVAVLRADREAETVPVTLRLAPADRGSLGALASVRAGNGTPLSELTVATHDSVPAEIYHKNMHRVTYVLGDVAGREESPVYAIGALKPAVARLRAPDGAAVHQMSTVLPSSDEGYSLKWDGEWQITFEVFRDMGAAFAVVLLLIYVLTVGWFKSFTTPLVIMLPIPLSLAGILPLHAALGAYFTATSMIGFIAGAGITVRNSIILVDFIELRRAQGLPLDEAVIDAGAVRFRPMVLTAAAVAVGGGVILFDPIFQGLAVSLIGGEVAATVLSRVAVPVLYYLVRRRDRAPQLAGGVA